MILCSVLVLTSTWLLLPCFESQQPCCVNLCLFSTNNFASKGPCICAGLISCSSSLIFKVPRPHKIYEWTAKRRPFMIEWIAGKRTSTRIFLAAPELPRNNKSRKQRKFIQCPLDNGGPCDHERGGAGTLALPKFIVR